MKLTKEQITRRLHCGVKLHRKGYDDQYYNLVLTNRTVSYHNGVEAYELFENPYETFKPILRPLSDLTKPIKQANYNEGKEFVPIDELAEISSCDANDEWVGHVYDFEEKLHEVNFDACPLELYKLLLKWHFVIDEAEGSYINVNELESNPYE